MKPPTRIALAVTGAAAAAALVAGIAPTMVSGPAVNADLTPGSSSATEAPNPKQSTVGFDYWNASAETFRYLSKTGKVAAPPTGDFLPGTKQNLEVPYNVIHDDDSTVTWGIYGFDGGPQVGTLTTSVNNAGESSVSLLGMDGKNLTTMTYKSSGGAWVIEDAAGSPAATAVNTYPAGSTDEQTAISNLCRNVDVTSSCSFAPTSQDVNAYGARPSELGVLYNSSSSSTQLTVGESQSYSVTDSWGATVTGQGTIEALQLGIQVLQPLDLDDRHLEHPGRRGRSRVTPPTTRSRRPRPKRWRRPARCTAAEAGSHSPRRHSDCERPSPGEVVASPVFRSRLRCEETHTPTRAAPSTG